MDKPLAVVPVSALDDNYVWLLAPAPPFHADGSGGQAACVDPGEAAPVLAYLHAHGLTLAQIWITHHHRDHTGGIAELKRRFPACTVYGGSGIDEADITVGEGGRIRFAGRTVRVWHIPGHTDGHLAYLLEEGGRTYVFCGDTLFSAGCGRVFTGTPQQLAASCRRLGSLPDDTLVFPAHEYTAANLAFAAFIEPDNPDTAAARQQAARTPTLPVTLAHERRINPFLRTAEPAVARRAAELAGRVLPDETAVFTALRELKNGF
ncbi:Hydroxyacylglutathione hydrolase [Kingella potus]|uniref:Hydroxyacylglutathione hydrolase n=1 Tax=Kingella potus TaxID=265175 RepID=A0A377R5Z2_9NEIS|nr:hydroxyacylglutathione hydrolase [Kingella potus]STR03402.1 Hydroxyacylglutathione hydrolase [Kingella potus]